MVTAISGAGTSSALELFNVKSTPNTNVSSQNNVSFSSHMKEATEPDENVTYEKDKAVACNEENLVENDNAVEDTPKDDIFDQKAKEKEPKDYVSTVSQMVVQISEILGISPEQMVDAMSEAQLTPEDLLTTEGMTELIMEVKNLDSAVGIILDSDIHNQFKEAMEFINENGAQLTEELANGNPKDFQSIKDSLKVEVNQMLQNTEGNAEIAEDLNGIKDTFAEENNDSQDMKNSLNLSQKENVDNSQRNQMENPQTGQEGTEGKEHQTTTEGDGKAINIIPNQSGSYQSVVDGITGALSERYDSVTADNIIRQITDNIKATTGNNITSLELSLNPESLGKVNIQIISKDGAVTAQISAETEAARHAIESQVASLKETLNNQNIKVDAVEVMVGTKNFEQEKESDNNESKQQNRRRVSRRINIEDFMDEQEEQEEDEILMKVEGNTISYSA